MGIKVICDRCGIETEFKGHYELKIEEIPFMGFTDTPPPEEKILCYGCKNKLSIFMREES